MYDIQEMQKVQLEIFRDVYNVCEKNEIPVFLAYGTAIGAVRHNGFIPWDDDIDIYIFQEDRERFFQACSKELPPKYFYQTVKTEPNYRLAIDRIRNSETTLIEADENGRDINHGIFIDVYPLYKCSDSKCGWYLQRISMLLYRLFLYNDTPKNKGKLTTLISAILLKLTPSFIKAKILNTAVAYTQKKGDDNYLCAFYGNAEKLKYKKELFEKSELVKFEDLEAPIPIGYDMILRLQYGDYMQLPPVEKRKVHHDFVCVDCKKSYKEYV